MPKIFHKEDLKFQKKPSRVPEFEWNISPRLGQRVNSKYLDFHVVSLDPDKYSFPYHFHRASEELFMVLSGEATLRSPEGFQKVSEGDIIFFKKVLQEHISYTTTVTSPLFIWIYEQPAALTFANILTPGKLIYSPLWRFSRDLQR